MSNSDKLTIVDKFIIIENFNFVNKRVFKAFTKNNHPLSRSQIADNLSIAFETAVGTKVGSSHTFLNTKEFTIKARRKLFKSEYNYNFLAYHHLELIWRM